MKSEGGRMRSSVPSFIPVPELVVCSTHVTDKSVYPLCCCTVIVLV